LLQVRRLKDQEREKMKQRREKEGKEEPLVPGEQKSALKSPEKEANVLEPAETSPFPPAAAGSDRDSPASAAFSGRGSRHNNAGGDNNLLAPLSPREPEFGGPVAPVSVERGWSRDLPPKFDSDAGAGVDGENEVERFLRDCDFDPADLDTFRDAFGDVGVNTLGQLKDMFDRGHLASSFEAHGLGDSYNKMQRVLADMLDGEAGITPMPPPAFTPPVRTHQGGDAQGYPRSATASRAVPEKMRMKKRRSTLGGHPRRRMQSSGAPFLHSPAGPHISPQYPVSPHRPKGTDAQLLRGQDPRDPLAGLSPSMPRTVPQHAGHRAGRGLGSNEIGFGPVGVDGYI